MRERPPGIPSQTRGAFILPRADQLIFLPPRNPAWSSVLFKGDTFSQQRLHLVPTLEKVSDSPGPTRSDSWPFPLFFDLCFPKFQIPPPTSILKRKEREKEQNHDSSPNCFSSKSRVIVFTACRGRRSPLIFCPGLGNLLYPASCLPFFGTHGPRNPSS